MKQCQDLNCHPPLMCDTNKVIYRTYPKCTLIRNSQGLEPMPSAQASAP